MDSRARPPSLYTLQELSRSEDKIRFACGNIRMGTGEDDSLIRSVEHELVGQINRLQHRADLVIPIRTPTENFQHPVDLREGGNAEAHHRSRKICVM
jgi:hypothetical protein